MPGNKQGAQKSNRRHIATAVFEAIEARQMMSATPQINFPTFADVGNLVFNGYGTDVTTSQNQLQLTSTSLVNETRSVWNATKVPIDAFTTNFQTTATSLLSTDGFTFAIQNDGTDALGGSGPGLGYSGLTNSLAVLFNLTNGVASHSSQFSVSSNGSTANADQGMGLLDLNGNEPINVSVTYNGTTLSVTASNPLDTAQNFNWSQAMDIPAIIGSDAAYVGFTAASGLSVANQIIQNWSFTGYSDPSITDAPTPSQSNVVGRFVDLNTLGNDALGESGLTYDWSVISAPRGAKSVQFSDNGTNTAKSAQARFYKAGHYVMQMTVTNSEGLTAVQNLSMDVAQTAKTVRMTPHNLRLKVGNSAQFSSTLIDQFGHSIAETPTWSVTNNRGTIGSSTGLFTASKKNVGHITVDADYDGLLGTAGVTVAR